MKQTVTQEKRFTLILEDFWIFCLLQLKVFVIAVELFAQHVTPARMSDHPINSLLVGCSTHCTTGAFRNSVRKLHQRKQRHN